MLAPVVDFYGVPVVQGGWKAKTWAQVKRPVVWGGVVKTAAMTGLFSYLGASDPASLILGFAASGPLFFGLGHLVVREAVKEGFVPKATKPITTFVLQKNPKESALFMPQAKVLNIAERTKYYLKEKNTCTVFSVALTLGAAAMFFVPTDHGTAENLKETFRNILFFAGWGFSMMSSRMGEAKKVWDAVAKEVYKPVYRKEAFLPDLEAFENVRAFPNALERKYRKERREARKGFNKPRGL